MKIHWMENQPEDEESDLCGKLAGKYIDVMRSCGTWLVRFDGITQSESICSSRAEALRWAEELAKDFKSDPIVRQTSDYLMVEDLARGCTRANIPFTVSLIGNWQDKHGNPPPAEGTILRPLPQSHTRVTVKHQDTTMAVSPMDSTALIRITISSEDA